MSSTYKHMDIDERKTIERALDTPGITRKIIASQINRDPKTVSLEITKHRTLVIRSNARNTCGRQMHCEQKRLCSDCIHGLCKLCRHDNCNAICPDYTKEPDCERLQRFPFVCSGCPLLTSCNGPKYFYKAENAQKMYDHSVSDWKSGPQLDDLEMQRIVPILQDGIRKKQSLDVIIHVNDLPISLTTAYRYIEEHRIPGITTMDLPRKVRYKPRKAIRTAKITPAAANRLEGRTFGDFTQRLLEDPELNVWQMDTVIGKRDEDKCILTLLYMRTNLQLYFLLDAHTSLEVTRVFQGLLDYLQEDLFKRTFEVILTDNGSEFSDPLTLECSPYTGEKLISIYYCDPRRSDQKGGCEKNHEHLRQIFPSGKSLESLSRKDVRYASNMINNYPRKKFQYRSPLILSEFFLEKKVFELNALELISADQVSLTPLIK